MAAGTGTLLAGLISASLIMSSGLLAARLGTSGNLSRGGRVGIVQALADASAAPTDTVSSGTQDRPSRGTAATPQRHRTGGGRSTTPAEEPGAPQGGGSGASGEPDGALLSLDVAGAASASVDAEPSGLTVDADLLGLDLPPVTLPVNLCALPVC